MNSWVGNFPCWLQLYRGQLLLPFGKCWDFYLGTAQSNTLWCRNLYLPIQCLLVKVYPRDHNFRSSACRIHVLHIHMIRMKLLLVGWFLLNILQYCGACNYSMFQHELIDLIVGQWISHNSQWLLRLTPKYLRNSIGIDIWSSCLSGHNIRHFMRTYMIWIMSRNILDTQLGLTLNRYPKSWIPRLSSNFIKTRTSFWNIVKELLDVWVILDSR